MRQQVVGQFVGQGAMVLPRKCFRIGDVGVAAVQEYAARSRVGARLMIVRDVGIVVVALLEPQHDMFPPSVGIGDVTEDREDLSPGLFEEPQLLITLCWRQV